MPVPRLGMWFQYFPWGNFDFSPERPKTWGGDAVVIGFIANELISIVENAGLMGLPLPAAITKAVDILTTKVEKKG